MKGILKIYHPEETLKYFIKSTYCKAVYSNKQHFLEVEITTEESLEHVEDDSLQYKFPQLTFNVVEFPVDDGEIADKTFALPETDDSYTEVDLYDDEDAYLHDCSLSFTKNNEDILELFWSGTIDDFFTGASEPIPFKLKCNFKPDVIEVGDE